MDLMRKSFPCISSRRRNAFTICRNPMPTQKKFSWLVENSGAGDSTYLQYDHDITQRSIAWLEEEASKNSDQPWALFVSLVCPHPPWIAPDNFSIFILLKKSLYLLPIVNQNARCIPALKIFEDFWSTG